MTTAIRHHKMIVSDPLESTIHRTGISLTYIRKKSNCLTTPIFNNYG